MKRLICLAAGFCLLAATSIPSAAQYSLKWEQPPNCLDGYNVASLKEGETYLSIVADDFQCNDPRPISQIRLWGSFYAWMETTSGPDIPPPDPSFWPTSFEISWHSYTHPEGEFSRPDQLLRLDTCPSGEPIWWCSHEQWNAPGLYEHEYYFDVFTTDPEPFPQVEGYYYFLNVVADYETHSFFFWGWKNSEDHWNDDAVRSSDGGGTWEELTWPEGHRLEGQSMDMAFELYVLTSPTPTATPTATPSATPTATPTAGPTAEPTPVPPGLKWAQPPNCTDGFNIPSYGYLGINAQVLADDFQCDDPRPIVKIRWWGSFENWRSTDPVWEDPPPYPEGLPTGFLISWHTYTHPEGEFSRPDELISEGVCDLYEAGWWCSHPVWNLPGHYEHEYYFECFLPTPFEQVEGQYYFVNIVADYPSAPLYAWGWKNSEYHWNDDAVLDSGTGIWNELTWPEGHRLESQSMDMAFELYVETTPIPTPPATPPPTVPPTPPPTVPPTPTPKPSATPTVRPTGTLTPPPTAPPTPTPTAPPTPIPPPAPRWIYDYDGDGTSDIAIFRPSTGLWAIRSVSRIYFGTGTDITVPGDYDGDGTAEAAVFRQASGLWAVRGVTRAYFGRTGDLPRPADYTGDGRWDIALFRPSSGLWAVRGGARIYFGAAGDQPVSGYYAIGPAVPAVFRPASGLWAVRSVTRAYFGTIGDTPVPGDYGGSGNWSPAIFRSSTGLWAVRGGARVYFGTPADHAVPGVYLGDGSDQVGVFRPSTGLWGIRQASRVYFGRLGDIPVSR